MKVTVLSRRNAMAYCYQSHVSPSVMISISDPNMRYDTAPFCSSDNKVKKILRLSFADADRPGVDVYGRNASETDLMSREDAMKVRRLLESYPGLDVIVHCDAGISRSAGVAAGILKAKTGDDSQVFDDPGFCPNRHCYRVTLQALLFGETAE